jgi:hypothetical protein
MTSFLNEVFNCSVMDGACTGATPVKTTTSLLMTPDGQPPSSFSLDDQVTCFHKFVSVESPPDPPRPPRAYPASHPVQDETWYHARITAVTSRPKKSPLLDVEYMDGEREINKEEVDVFKGLLSMVRENASGDHAATPLQPPSPPFALPNRTRSSSPSPCATGAWTTPPA